MKHDFTLKVGELGMYSYERPAYTLWDALANGLIDAGYSEKAALEWLRSKAARWALDGELGDAIAELGYQFGNGKMAQRLASIADCEKWAKE